VSGTVIVVGSINVDLVIQGEKLPGPGETVIGGTFVQAHGGKGANQAVAAARAGANVVLVGMLGDDDLGRQARAALDAEGIDTSNVGTSTSHTGVAEILVDAKGENLIAVASGANEDLSTSAVEAAFDAVRGDDVVVLSVLEIPYDAVMAAATGARARGWRFVLNPAPAKPLTPDLVELCELITPNEHEGTALGVSSAEDLLKQGAGAVIVTRGSKGADLYRNGNAPEHVDSFEVTPVDTTGAGDAFSGVLAAALAEGRDLADALRWAAAAGALATEKIGAREGMATRAALEKMVGA
jgi:ribokinase